MNAPQRTEVRAPWLTIAGCGPGGEDWIPAATQKAVTQATVLAGAPRLLELFPGAPGTRLALGREVGAFIDALAIHAGTPCTVLVSGDPGICSLATPLIARFGRSACRVIPAVGALQIACALCGLDATHAALVSCHGRTPDSDPPADADPVLILAGSAGAEAWAAGLARRRGLNCVTVCDDLTLATQDLRCLDLSTLEQLTGHPRRVLVLSAELDHG